MELSKNYEPVLVEEKWSKLWKQKGYFSSTPDHRKSFTVVIPPPNVTGVLHMGHTLNETVQDILVRKARMSGFNACWVPGSDHASIATEAKVVEMLKKEKGIEKSQLTREEFLRYAFEWREKYGNIIYHQIEKLGCSVDWNRVSFTMDEHYYKAVIKVFVDLYNKGKIYRGARMINWDPAAKTALSDEEVEYKEVEGKLYYVKYRIAETENGREEFVVIATQRPETIMGDTAVCVNPNDERYRHLKGRHAIIPLVNRKAPIIFDEYVDPAFGTGALKVTPAHDINDYNLGLKHNLEVVDTLNPDGTLSEAAQVFVGMERFAARKKVVQALQEEGLLLKEEQYTTRLGFSQRSSAVVEPRISTQWFVAMRELADKALGEVLNGNVEIHPEERFLATYKYWLENIKDWCISRQLWWGQRIPAWYDNEGRMVVAENKEAALEAFKSMDHGPWTMDRITQDEDVLDTWFSSWLWPMEVFKGITNPGNSEIEYYYPTSVLVTGQDIIFFWVARMIMAGMEYMQEKPFSHVYFTGMVRDKQGRKMSKSLGNSPDLLELIAKYGADAVRFGIMISAPAGNDLLFDETSPEQGRNFNNKLWNALKLVRMWEERQADRTVEPVAQEAAISDHESLIVGDVSGFASNVDEGVIANFQLTNHFPIRWFESRLAQARVEIETLLADFKLSEALKTIYSLIWDDFCSWYLEWVKPGFEEKIDSGVYNKTIEFFSDLMQLLHPFMPFITEEIYHLLKQRHDDLCIRQFKEIETPDLEVLNQGVLLKEVITGLRDARNKNRLKPKDSVKLYIQSDNNDVYAALQQILSRQVNASAIAFTDETLGNTISVVIGKDKFFIQTSHAVDTESQKSELEKELNYLRGFLQSVDKKLGNERFIQNAKPDVIALEQKKKSDALEKIKILEESIANLQ
jgi:valyl-tRNA synthetase